MISININNLILISILILLMLVILFWWFYKKIARYKTLAYSDDFGIFNHRELNNRINILIKNTTIRSFAFMLIDIDNFKKYNDKYGYDKADKLLQEFVNITKSFVRKSDMFFRYKNGDEFVLIFNDIGIDEAKEIADRLRRIIAFHPFKIDDNQINLTISMGIAKSLKNDSAKEIRHRAEIALHEAKQEKNTVAVLKE